MSLQEKYTSCRSLLVLVCVLVGCTGDDTSQNGPPPQPEAIEPSSFAPYFQCDESVADHVLLVSITVPGVLDGRHPFRIPFRKAEPDGGGGGGSSFNGTGPDGGFNAFISIESSTDTTLSVRVDLHWSLSQEKGEVKELIDIPIGKSGKKDLPEGRNIQWRFVEPEREMDD